MMPGTGCPDPAPVLGVDNMPAAGNYIKLEQGVYDVMRFDGFKKVKKEVVDPVLGFPKDITTLDFHVIELNGEKVNTLFSITSSVLQSQLEPYLAAEKYLMYRFTFTQTPGAFQPPRLVQASHV